MPVLPKADNGWVQVEAHYDDAWNTPWPLDSSQLKVNGKVVTEDLAVNKA
jgi:hypothetical protein